MIKVSYCNGFKYKFYPSLCEKFYFILLKGGYVRIFNR